jgi:hypothetical protein
MNKFNSTVNKILENTTTPLNNDKKMPLADKIEEVFDMVDRGEINTPEEVIAQFDGYNVDRELLKSIVDEEFTSGGSERWGELKDLDSSEDLGPISPAVKRIYDKLMEPLDMYFDLSSKDKKAVDVFIDSENPTGKLILSALQNLNELKVNADLG